MVKAISAAKAVVYSSVTATLLLSGEFTLAQTASEGADTLDVIVVTARKREETIQDIPLSVSAIGSETIERAGVENLEDIAALTAGLTFQTYNGGGLGSPTIRGLAQTDIASVDNNVGVFIDGVFINNKGSLSLNLLDIERVEVVKGPQSALYGNNTFGGAINYVTRRPTDTTTGRVTATIGSDELYELGASISGTLIEDKWTAGISASTSSFDGTIENTLGENLGGWDDKTNVTLNSTFHFNDSVSARLFYYHGDEEFDASAGVIVANNCGGDLGSPSGLTGRGQTTQRYFCGDLQAPDSVTVSPLARGNESTTDIGYLNLTFDLASTKLTSLTSYADSESSALSDQKFNVPDSIVAPASRRFSSPFFGNIQTFSQELRLESFDNDSIGWAVGAYYIDWESDRKFQVGTAADPGSVLDLGDLVESTAVSFFGLLEYSFSDALTGSIEARHTSDERDATLSFAGFTTGAFNETFDFTTYRASLNYNLNSDALFYGSVARGAKTGGFNNTTVASEQAFDSEFNTTFEFGYKTSPDNPVAFNAAVYYSDWTDVQLTNPSSVPGNTNVTQNVGDVTSIGFEVDLMWRPTDEFSLSAGYSFSDPTFESGTIDFTHGRRCGVPADCGLQAGPAGGINVSDQTIDRISEHQLYVSPQYAWEWASFSYYLRGDVTYQSEQFQRSLNLQTIEARTLLNARFGVITEGGLEIALWAKNLTDENYFVSAINEPEFLFDFADFTLYQSTFSTGFLANGRQVGLSLNYAWN